MTAEEYAQRVVPHRFDFSSLGNAVVVKNTLRDVVTQVVQSAIDDTREECAKIIEGVIIPATTSERGDLAVAVFTAMNDAAKAVKEIGAAAIRGME